MRKKRVFKLIRNLVALICVAIAILGCRSSDTIAPPDAGLMQSDGHSTSDNDSDSPFGTADVPDASIDDWSCPDSTQKYVSSNDEVWCCPDQYPLFCDATDQGYDGGCWNDSAECDSLTECGGSWKACAVGSLPYCENNQLRCISCPVDHARNETSSGRPVCCPEDHPVFCDETSSSAHNYEGGCWESQADCELLTWCAEKWWTCPSGREPICDEDSFYCRVL